MKNFTAERTHNRATYINRNTNCDKIQDRNRCSFYHSISSWTPKVKTKL